MTSSAQRSPWHSAPFAHAAFDAKRADLTWAGCVVTRNNGHTDTFAAGDYPHGLKARTEIAESAQGPLGRWAVGPLGRWAVGPLGRWAVGPLGRWAVGPLGRWRMMMPFTG